ncbi:hypothetical protein LINGRAHAP2_LOCUS8091 [Linum grandiflorum]
MLRYEKIPLMCFICGLLGHDKAHCPRKFQPSFSNLRFRPELQARRGRMQVDEIFLRRVPIQLPESYWNSFGARFNHYKISTEEEKFSTNIINDSVIVHEPFFQQQQLTTKQELHLIRVETVAFF